MTSFLFACLFRFVPYIGIVTILMNDYPKFKVRAYPTCFITHALFCLLLGTITWVTDLNGYFSHWSRAQSQPAHD